MYKELMQAMAGGIYAAAILRKNKADRYIFFPKDKGAYLKWGMKLLPQYMARNQFIRVIIVAADDSVRREMVRQGMADVQFKKMSKQSMGCLLNYYALKDMSDQWTVVSTRVPYDTGAEHMLGIKGTTYRDIVYYDIYRLDGELT